MKDLGLKNLGPQRLETAVQGFHGSFNLCFARTSKNSYMWTTRLPSNMHSTWISLRLHLQHLMHSPHVPVWIVSVSNAVTSFSKSPKFLYGAIRCNRDKSVLCHVVPIYLRFLILASFFLARQRPKSQFLAVSCTTRLCTKLVASARWMRWECVLGRKKAVECVV